MHIAGLILIRTRTYNLIDTIIVRIMVVLGKAQIILVELNRQILRPFAGNPLIPQINFHLAVPGYLQHVLLAADVKVRELAAVSEQADDFIAAFKIVRCCGFNKPVLIAVYICSGILDIVLQKCFDVHPFPVSQLVKKRVRTEVDDISCFCVLQLCFYGVADGRLRKRNGKDREVVRRKLHLADAVLIRHIDGCSSLAVDNHFLSRHGIQLRNLNYGLGLAIFSNLFRALILRLLRFHHYFGGQRLNRLRFPGLHMKNLDRIRLSAVLPDLLAGNRHADQAVFGICPAVV